jgi:hypothetical protein
MPFTYPPNFLDFGNYDRYERIQHRGNPYLRQMARFAVQELLETQPELYYWSDRLSSFRTEVYYRVRIYRAFVKTSRRMGAPVYKLRIRIRSQGRCIGGMTAFVLDRNREWTVMGFGRELPCRTESLFGLFN